MIRDGLVVQWPDTHIPDHHRLGVKSITNFIKEVQPELVLFTGDLADLLSVARWTSDTIEENGRLLQKEMDSVHRVLGGLREGFAGRVEWMPGNHETRLTKWGRTRGRGLFGLDALTFPSLARFDDFGIGTPAGVLDESAPYEFAPGVVAIHGTTVRKYAGYSVHAEMEKFGRSVVMGHTHRLALVHRRNHARTAWGMEGGHLMDQRKAGYLAYGTADWQMGFGLIEVVNGVAWPTIVPMDGNGKFMWGREVWAA